MHDAALVQKVGGYAEAQFFVKADDLHLRVDDDVGAAQNLPAVGNGRLHHFQAVPLSTHGCEHPADVGATVFSVASGIGDDLVVLSYGDVGGMEVLLIELRAEGNLLLQHKNLLPHLADAEELLYTQFTEGFYGYCPKGARYCPF